MDAAAEIGKNPVSKHPTQPKYRISRLTRDGIVERLSRPNYQARTGIEKYSFSLFS